MKNLLVLGFVVTLLVSCESEDKRTPEIVTDSETTVHSDASGAPAQGPGEDVVEFDDLPLKERAELDYFKFMKTHDMSADGGISSSAVKESFDFLRKYRSLQEGTVLLNPHQTFHYSYKFSIDTFVQDYILEPISFGVNSSDFLCSDEVVESIRSHIFTFSDHLECLLKNEDEKYMIYNHSKTDEMKEFVKIAETSDESCICRDPIDPYIIEKTKRVQNPDGSTGACVSEKVKIIGNVKTEESVVICGETIIHAHEGARIKLGTRRGLLRIIDSELIAYEGDNIRVRGNITMDLANIEGDVTLVNTSAPKLTLDVLILSGLTTDSTPEESESKSRFAVRIAEDTTVDNLIIENSDLRGVIRNSFGYVTIQESSLIKGPFTFENGKELLSISNTKISGEFQFDSSLSNFESLDLAD